MCARERMYFIFKQINFNAIESFDGAESAAAAVAAVAAIVALFCLFCIVRLYIAV